jgi:hypothetical protein
MSTVSATLDRICSATAIIRISMIFSFNASAEALERDDHGPNRKMREGAATAAVCLCPFNDSHMVLTNSSDAIGHAASDALHFNELETSNDAYRSGIIPSSSGLTK